MNWIEEQGESIKKRMNGFPTILTNNFFQQFVFFTNYELNFKFYNITYMNIILNVFLKHLK